MVYSIDELNDKAVFIVKRYGVKRLTLFGSYASGEATGGSDLDFYIDNEDLRGCSKYFFSWLMNWRIRLGVMLI